jgi:hypothetical protein
MKLLDEITGLLSSGSAPLSDALLKTKVLLHAIGKQELVGWVNSELNGYPDPKTVPLYRTLRGQVLANLSNAAWRATAHPIPLGHLDEKQRRNLETVHMAQSLAELEKLAATDSTSSPVLQFAIPLEANVILGQQLAGGFHIERAWTAVPKVSITSILIQVRSRLLDFILGLNEKFEGAMTDQEVKTRTGAFDASQMFSQAIFGDNTTVIVGHKNTQTVTNANNIRGDFAALAGELQRHGIDETDINLLKDAIVSDEGASETRTKNFGPAVRMWMQRMWGKAMDASWNVELGIVSGLLTTVIQKYYGWS